MRGWDDPRMPTICGMRRRGYTPEAIRDFCSRIGVARAENLVEYSLLEFCVREHLNAIAPRTMAVLDPIKVVIENYPEAGGMVRHAFQSGRQRGSSRKVPFSRELYIERDDFREDPPKKFHRLFPGSEVRLRYAYYVTCKDVIKDADGNIVELRCTYDPESKGGATPTDARSRAPSIGFPCPTPYPPKCACTSTCSRPRRPAIRPKAWSSRIC